MVLILSPHVSCFVNLCLNLCFSQIYLCWYMGKLFQKNHFGLKNNGQALLNFSTLEFVFIFSLYWYCLLKHCSHTF